MQQKCSVLNRVNGIEMPGGKTGWLGPVHPALHQTLSSLWLPVMGRFTSRTLLVLLPFGSERTLTRTLIGNSLRYIYLLATDLFFNLIIKQKRNLDFSKWNLEACKSSSWGVSLLCMWSNFPRLCPCHVHTANECLNLQIMAFPDYEQAHKE